MTQGVFPLGTVRLVPCALFILVVVTCIRVLSHNDRVFKCLLDREQSFRRTETQMAELSKTILPAYERMKQQEPVRTENPPSATEEPSRDPRSPTFRES